MRRRAFIAGLSSAAAWPVVARAQQSDKIRRVGVLMGYVETDPEAQERLLTFRRGLATLGWSEGSNLHIDVRWSSGDAARATSFAKELLALQPNAILAHGTAVTTAIQHETSAIPVVFVQVSDPIGSGFVESLSRPGSNITGFLNLEDSMVGKSLELLKEIAIWGCLRIEHYGDEGSARCALCSIRSAYEPPNRSGPQQSASACPLSASIAGAMSSARRTSDLTTSIPRVRAASRTWLVSGAVTKLVTSPIVANRVRPGITSRRISIRFRQDRPRIDSPVTFPLGRAILSTSPPPTGSVAIAKTIGIAYRPAG
jgi:ABC transporter substrate binding protein